MAKYSNEKNLDINIHGYLTNSEYEKFKNELEMLTDKYDIDWY